MPWADYDDADSWYEDDEFDGPETVRCGRCGEEVDDGTEMADHWAEECEFPESIEVCCDECGEEMDPEFIVVTDDGRCVHPGGCEFLDD